MAEIALGISLALGMGCGIPIFLYIYCKNRRNHMELLSGVCAPDTIKIYIDESLQTLLTKESYSNLLAGLLTTDLKKELILNSDRNLDKFIDFASNYGHDEIRDFCIGSKSMTL